MGISAPLIPLIMDCNDSPVDEKVSVRHELPYPSLSLNPSRLSFTAYGRLTPQPYINLYNNLTTLTWKPGPSFVFFFLLNCRFYKSTNLLYSFFTPDPPYYPGVLFFVLFKNSRSLLLVEGELLYNIRLFCYAFVCVCFGHPKVKWFIVKHSCRREPSSILSPKYTSIKKKN